MFRVCNLVVISTRERPGKKQNYVQGYDLLKNQLLRLLLVASFCNDWIEGGAPGPSPPPPRRGLAMRLPAAAKLKPPPVALRPFVLPALAASRRSFTEASWTSNLGGEIVG